MAKGLGDGIAAFVTIVFVVVIGVIAATGFTAHWFGKRAGLEAAQDEAFMEVMSCESIKSMAINELIAAHNKLKPNEPEGFYNCDALYRLAGMDGDAR